MADRLAKQLDAHLRLLMPYEVPYALPLTRPPVPVGIPGGRNCAPWHPKRSMEIAAHIYLCRDKQCALCGFS